MAWEMESCVLKDCPLVKSKIPVMFQPEDIRRIKTLLKKYPDKEWLMYLYGDIALSGVTISKMTIPKQEVSGGSVDNIEAPLSGCIGTIHSHNTMGAFHSGTDQAYIEENHSVCITVNNKLEFETTVSTMSECKKPMIVKGEVFQTEEPLDLTGFLKEADENIKEHKIEYSQYQNPYIGRVWDPDKGVWKDRVDIVKTDTKYVDSLTANSLEAYWY